MKINKIYKKLHSSLFRNSVRCPIRDISSNFSSAITKQQIIFYLKIHPQSFLLFLELL